jgi:EF hand
LLSGMANAAVVEPSAAVAALDRSGDGQVELAEYQAYQAVVFKARDVDGSTTLAFPEFESTLSGGARANAKASFDGFDADQDAALSMNEFSAYQALVFTRFIDRNEDGFMTAEELAALSGAAGSGGSSGPMTLDRNRDGGVDAGEYNAFHSGRFSGVDLDKSGSLSFIEFKKSLDPSAARNARASFDGFDLNKNRRLSDREFLTYHSFVFQRFLDKDRSGSVTAAEWAAIADRNN